MLPEWELFVGRINEWALDPVAFSEEACGLDDLDGWQCSFLSSIAGKRRTTVRAGRGCGKSTTVAIGILWFLVCFSPAKVLVTAPKADQAADVIWSEVEILRQRMPAVLADAIVVQSDSIYVKGLERINFAAIRTARADNPDALRGAHAENILVICEESSGIADTSFIVLEGTMTTANAKMVLVGNMSRTSGYFYDSHFADLAGIWSKIHVNCEVVARNGHRWFNDDFVRSMASKYGVESDEYRIEVLGEPPQSEERAVIPRYLIEAATYREVEVIRGVVPVWGLDVGRVRDRSALAKRCGNHLLEPVKWWREPDTTVLADQVVEEYRLQERRNREMLPAEILVDVIGLGAGVLDMLVRQGLPARGINVAEAHPSKDRYLRKRDELWFKARDWFAGMDVYVPSDPAFIGELSSVQWDETESGKRKVESKSEIRAKSRESPDLADAFILTFANGYDRIPDMLEKKEYKFKHRRDDRCAPSWMSI